MQTIGRVRRPGRRTALLALGAFALPIWAGGSAQAQIEVTIPQIQGAGHVSPYLGQEVTTRGVVTAVAFSGYYVQDPVGDGNDATSDGMFVSQGSPAVNVGDLVELTDTIEENIGGGAATGNLSITRMRSPVTTVLSSGNALPFPVTIGTSGRVPPNRIVISEDELPVNLQTDPGLFDPQEDAIDFYEALEGMRVTVEEPVAVSGTRTFSPFSSEVFTLPNDGANVAPSDARTARGGISLQPDPDNLGDQNPERVQIQFDGTLFPFPVPAITVGDMLGNVTGVVGYSFGNFEVNATEQFSITPGGLDLETTLLTGSRRAYTVASYNVLNLDPNDSDGSPDISGGQYATLASHIVSNLGSPDVIALQEIQDNNGTVNDGTTASDVTLTTLVDAIFDAGGPRYEFFDVAPADGASGGVPGGNIRNAFLYNPDWIDLVDFVSLTPSALTAAGVDNPTAFAGTRDPLVGVFRFRRQEFTVINNHLTSRFGSTPIFGGVQPFVQAGEAAREAQVQALNDYVDILLADDRRRRIIVLGDLNTFEFTNDISEILTGVSGGDDDDDDDDRRRGRVLTNLIDRLDDDNVYTFNFEGNSQVLDHFLVSRSLRNRAVLDIVHVNVDFPRVNAAFGSDHEPLLAVIGPRIDDDDDDDDGDDDDGDEDEDD